ncbi:MAG: hypothetical protein ACR2NP_21865, partial [Pirellulaceae bacterium]
TVRSRGVMEKCTFCVQRIQNTRIVAKTEGNRDIGANEITTACQDACPADAVVFGNLKIDDDRVSRLKHNPRNYDLLKYIGALPRTSYLARVKNPNPKMPGAENVGKTTARMH